MPNLPHLPNTPNTSGIAGNPGSWVAPATSGTPGTPSPTSPSGPYISADRAGHVSPLQRSLQPGRGRRHALGMGMQMVIASVAVALAAVLIVAVITLFAVSVAFRQYQTSQMEGDAARMSQTIGNGGYFTKANGLKQLDTLAKARQATESIWIIDAYGNVVVHPAETTTAQQTVYWQDQQVILPSLETALQGQPSAGQLADPLRVSMLAQRVYAVAPIYVPNDTGSDIAGAIAVTSPPRNDAAAYTIFQSAVDRIILISALLAALVAVVAALLFARRLTGPLSRLTRAATRMASGDYSTRVDLHTTDEYVRLTESFNEMAAALERDVNELQRQEQLRRELVANVSHELATPLTAIAGFSEALLDGVVHQPQQREETVRLISRECSRLRRLVDQLRQVALYEAGRQKLDCAPVQIAELADETLAVLQPELARKQVQARSLIPANLPPVFVDADRLTEVLLNLLDNALRHVPPGGQIEVSGAMQGQFVRVDIADNGPGISAADRARVFDRFYRADRSRSSSTGGSGLGLAIVRALVEAHGGTIAVDEHAGGGACFSFTLPAAPQPHSRLTHV